MCIVLINIQILFMLGKKIVFTQRDCQQARSIGWVRIFRKMLLRFRRGFGIILPRWRHGLYRAKKEILNWNFMSRKNL